MMQTILCRMFSPGRTLLITGLLIFAGRQQLVAQNTDSLPNYRIGICAPVYLDSAFKNGVYRFQKDFPRFLLPGLDFMQGSRIALDSMPLHQARIEVRFFDVKSGHESVDSLIHNHALDSLQLIIGSVRDEDFRKLAAFAKSRQVPFISVTYPNDGGITDNPFVAIANPTLRSHCEFLYTYISENHKRENLLLVHRSGSRADRIAGYFQALQSEGWGSKTRLKPFVSDSNFNALKNVLDSNKLNVIIGASLDEDFATSLVQYVTGLPKKYRVKLIGMPNWKNFPGLVNPKKSAIADLPVYFTQEFYSNRTDSFSILLQDAYLKRYKGKPSDFAYKGFETTYVFSKLCTAFPLDLMSHLNECPFTIFTTFRFEPVRLQSKKQVPDYFENKQLHLLKLYQGKISQVN